jgi:predicted lipid-binding transport protein (Tim44 family)
MAYSSFSALEGSSVPTFRAPSLAALQHIRDTDPAFSESDFLSFAKETFNQIQQGWGKRDWRGIRHLLSPEMLVLFQKDLDQLLAEKRINRIENIRIPKAEISDALQDRGEELITVKLVVRLNDYTIDEKSGQLLSGDPQIPIEFREYWTFPRNIGERIWVLAGISQNSIQ